MALIQAVLSIFLTEMDTGESEAAQMAVARITKSKECHSVESERYLKELESNPGNINNGMFELTLRVDV